MSPSGDVVQDQRGMRLCPGGERDGRHSRMGRLRREPRRNAPAPQVTGGVAWTWSTNLSCYAGMCERRLVQQFRARDHVLCGGAAGRTVTLVFTDIEGSTALLDDLGAEARRRWPTTVGLCGGGFRCALGLRGR